MTEPDTGLHIIPMGGVGDMGMNLMLYRYGDDYLMVDCGVRFPDVGAIGVEHLLPNLASLRNLKGKLLAIVLTHGHEDHIGSLRWVLRELPVPVYGTPFTLGLVESRLSEANLPETPVMHEFNPGDEISIGPFDLSFYRVTHSIPDCVSVAIQTPEGVVVQTGDFKIDERPLDGEAFDREGLRALGDRGVRLLLSDSTNASVPGRTRDEVEVAENLEEAIAEWPGRVIVTLFSSNLYRVSSLHKIARKHGRVLCLVGRSLFRYVQNGRRTTEIDLPEPQDVFELGEVAAFDPGKVLVLCTGSQAEPMSALYRASREKHSGFKLAEGDRVIFSSREIPGNEFRIGKMINDICRLGAEVLKGHRHGMHASGHARAGELSEMLELIRPDLFVPVHGEYAFLQAHIALAEALGLTNTKLIENGSILKIKGSEELVVAEIDAEPWVHDGGICATASEMMLSERKRVAWNGVVDVHITRRGPFDRRSYDLELSSTALFVDGGKLLEQCRKKVQHSMIELDGDASGKKVEERVQQEVRRFFRTKTSKRPFVFTHLVDER